MGRETNRPLSVEEAKAQLRATAANTKAADWIQRNPWESLMIALVSGLLLGSSRKARDVAGDVFAWILKQSVGSFLLR